MLYNPHRNYDKGMDDAYMGLEPDNTNGQQYMEGYEYAVQLLESGICSQCNGEGTVPGKRGGNEGVPESDVEFECSECNGTGKIK